MLPATVFFFFFLLNSAFVAFAVVVAAVRQMETMVHGNFYLNASNAGFLLLFCCGPNRKFESFFLSLNKSKTK